MADLLGRREDQSHREHGQRHLRGGGGRMISSLLEIMAVVGALELVVAVGEAILIVVILRWVRP
nr:MAG TPA: hypothetical protein [Caudoviricetes sp.]